LAETHKELQLKNAELEHLKRLLAHKEKTIEEIFDSRSWKVTKPLRIFAALFRGSVENKS